MRNAPLFFIYILSAFQLQCAQSMRVEEKNHVLIANINSKGRANQLFAIGEELLLDDNDIYFVTFLITADVRHYLDEFMLRYPLRNYNNTYQVITTPPNPALYDPDTYYKLLVQYAAVVTYPFYTLYPVLHYYLSNCQDVEMKTEITDYSKYGFNITKFENENFLCKPIDVALIDWVNAPLIHLAKIHNIPTIALQTLFSMSFESNVYLSDAAIFTSRSSWDHIEATYSYTERMGILWQNLKERDIVYWYIGYKYNHFLDEFNITGRINHIFDVFDDSIILKSMGPPVCNKNMFTTQRYQYTGFLVPKHLDETKPWTNNITINIYGLEKSHKLNQWMDSKKNIIYVAFGTLVGVDPINQELFSCLLNGVFTMEFLDKYDYHILWSMREPIQSVILSENVEFYMKNRRIFFDEWLPQKELLHHPNIKLFITHGGTSSVIESIYASKPLLFASFNFLERAGNGVVLKEIDCIDMIEILENNTFNAKRVQKQINELILNVTHTQKCAELKEMMEFYGGKKKAVQILTYSIKFGAKHLVPLSIYDLAWYQKTYIDIYGIIAIFVYLVYYYLLKLRNKSKTHDKRD